MKTTDFDYNLPDELIAQKPMDKRDESCLMVIDKDVQKIEHKKFFDIIDYLQEGDLIVWNNSKVFNARLKAVIEFDESTDKKLEGKKVFNSPKEVEIFLIKPVENEGVWQCLAKPGKKLHLGLQVKIADNFVGEVLDKNEDGTVLIDFGGSDMEVREKANKYGSVPVPPYIKREEEKIKDKKELQEKYQTIYASDQKEGSVAAPTAGFHFTNDLIEKLKNKGVDFAEVTLHVGLGTFLPVKTEKIEEHKMHAEWVELIAKNADKINIAKKEGRRVVVVGTTTTRTLEGIASSVMLSKEKHPLNDIERDSSIPQNDNLVRAYSGEINIFITPGFEFKIVDALITNFHLPKSTLLMLVSAFAGDREFVLKCYQEAVKEKYRFYSFGDSMLIK